MSHSLTSPSSLLRLPIRDLKMRRRRRQLERQKNNRLGLAKQLLCTCITHFLYISLPSQHGHEHDYDVKMPNFTFYGGLKQATWIWFLGIQRQESSPKFDKVS